MVEILGNNLSVAIQELNVMAKRTFNSDEYEVWEMEEIERLKLNATTEEEWKENYGWFRYGDGANVTPCKTVKINGIEVIGYENERFKEAFEDEGFEGYEEFVHSYRGLTQHFEETCGATTCENVTAVSIEMARHNDMTLGELFGKLYNKQ